MIDFLNTLNRVSITYELNNNYSDQRLIQGPHDATSTFLLGCVLIELMDCVYETLSLGFNFSKTFALTKSQHQRCPQVDPLIIMLSL